MSYIKSKYTTLFKENDKCFLFNTQMCLFMEISQSAYNSLEKEDFSSLDVHEREIFISKKILIKEEEADDYYLEMKFKHQAMSTSYEILSLILIPTNGCNFACPYCFEKNKQLIFMSDKVIEDIIQFIKGHNKARKINITWYGGEPLLGFSQIRRFYELFEKHIDIPILNQSIVTNGYLLNEEKILFLRSKGIKSMQITLDGIRENHNKTRCLYPSGKGTFDSIIKNVDLALELMPDCSISIRVNIKKDNSEDFISLYKSLNDRWMGKNINIYPGFIREDTEDGRQLCSECIKNSEQIDFYLSLREKGIDVDLYPKCVTERGCVINSINSYIIGAEGEIYKCWNDVSNRQRIIGYVNDKNLINKTLFYRYMTECSPFTDSKCTKCNLLPICQGGCGWYRYRNLYENGDFDVCSMYRENNSLITALKCSMIKVESKCPTFYVK